MTAPARLSIHIVWCGNDQVVTFDMHQTRSDGNEGRQIPRLCGPADDVIPRIGEYLKARLEEVEYD